MSPDTPPPSTLSIPAFGTECPVGDASPDYPVLIGIGVSERTAREWIATYGTARVGQSLRYLRQYQAQGHKVPSPAGFVRRSLEHGWGMKLLTATPEEIAARHRKAREACYVPVSALKEGVAAIIPDFEEKRAAVKSMAETTRQAMQAAAASRGQNYPPTLI